MEDSAAALSSLTLTTALAVAQGGTGTTTVGGIKTLLGGIGTAATKATGFFATAAQGTKADSAQQPPSEGAFGNGDKTKLDGLSTQATTTAALALLAPLASPSFTGTVQAAGAVSASGAGTFLSINLPDSYPTGGTITANGDISSSAAIRGYQGHFDNSISVNGTNINTIYAGATQQGTNTSNIALKANIASPTFTGTVGGITKAMVGLGSVDNNSTATIQAGTTKANVGLGVVDNTSDANKPISDASIVEFGTKADLASPTFTGTVSGITKGMVGLGNVDNTTDALKPVSTAGQNALNLKANLAAPTFTGTTSAAAITTTGNVIVGGNLTVSGTVTTIDTETINLQDNFINLNSNETGTPSQDAGISIDRGTSNDANLFWDEAVDRWSLSLANLGGADTASTPDAYVGVIQQATTAIASLGDPTYGGANGVGTIYVKTDTNDVYIYA